jgi:hypothetical protein
MHRYHSGTPTDKSTLTLVVKSHADARQHWAPALRVLAAYIAAHNLSLKVEIIDARIFNGMFTLPIMAYDPVATVVAKRRFAIRKVLEESGVEWTSLEFWYRGVGRARRECVPTVLIGAPEAKGEMWWGREGVVAKVAEKVQGVMEVEVSWRKFGRE